MPTDQHPHGGRRPHFHRGRRGPDRRGDRRPQSQPQAASAEPNKGDGLDVDQIVREIKARIAQRHGIDLAASQIQELAARRLEAILDPRTIKPSLLEQLRRSAGAPADIAPVEPPAAYEFEDHTIFDTHNALLRSIRAFLRPILKLFFNPNPIAHALNAQARINKDAAKREEARERTQAEWNALHYTLVQRLVTEIARTSIDAQNLAMKVESLAARVDLYERRVRALENTAQPITAPAAAAQAPMAASRAATGGDVVVGADASGDGARRRRRRRRGRRGPGGPDVASGAAAVPGQPDAGGDEDEGLEDDSAPGIEGGESDSHAGSAPALTSPASGPQESPAVTAGERRDAVEPQLPVVEPPGPAERDSPETDS